MTGCHHRRDRVTFEGGAFHVEREGDLDPAWLDFAGHVEQRDLEPQGVLLCDVDDDEQPADDFTWANLGQLVAIVLGIWGLVDIVRAVAAAG